MNKGFLSVVAVLVLLGVGAWYVSTYVGSKTLSADEDTRVRTLVTEFGTKLQMVPLLAVTPERKTAMELYYGPYVAPELIAQWSPEGAEGAVGRYASSPWPERIEIVSVQKTAPGTYQVESNVIEVTSVEAGAGKAAAAIYPLTLTLKERDSKLLIVGATKGAYSEIPHSQVVVGYWECLPHKGSDTNTDECSIGIAVDQSDGHYALNLALMSRMGVDYPQGTKVRVQGVVTPANQLSSDHWQQYDIDGILSATSIEEIK